MKSHIFIEYVKKVIAKTRKSIFPHPRGPDAPGLIKLMELHPFLGVPGALGPIFAENHFFTKKLWNVENVVFLLKLDFSIKINIFVKLSKSQKHQYVLRNIDGFEGWFP